MGSSSFYRPPRATITRWLSLSIIVLFIIQFMALDFSELPRWASNLRVPAWLVERQSDCPGLSPDGGSLSRAILSNNMPDTICRPLDLATRAFTAEACYRPSLCGAVDIVIQRTDSQNCSAMERNNAILNDDPVWETWMRERLGPDSFMLLADGAERIVMFDPTRYEGSCTYRFSLRLRNGGPFDLQIWHHYSNYAAWNETNHEWPVLREESLLQSKLTFNVCPHCPTSVGYSEEAQILGAGDEAENAAVCNASFGGQGAFLPAPVVEHPTPRYRWVSTCRWDHAGLRYSNHLSCFNEALPPSLLFIGDSHVRVAYDGIVHRLQGNTDLMTFSEKSGDKHADFAGLSMRFLWDPAGEWVKNFECDDIKGYTHLALGFGRHLTQISTNEYMERLEAVLSRVVRLSQTCSENPIRLIWLSPTGIVPRDDHFPRDVKDRGTNTRYQAWTRLSLAAAHRAGWDGVNFFRYTAPFVKETPDVAHFLTTDGLDPLLDDLIGVLGICDTLEGL